MALNYLHSYEILEMKVQQKLISKAWYVKNLLEIIQILILNGLLNLYLYIYIYIYINIYL